MNKLTKAVTAAALAAALAGCSGSPDLPAQSTQSAQPEQTAQTEQLLQIQLDHSSFILKPWSTDGSHQTEIGGKLVYGDQPVSGADLHVGDSKRNVTTAEDGTFTFMIDQSLLGQTPVKVVSLENAMAGGKPITKEKAQDPSLSAAVQVQYPILIHSSQASPTDPGKVIVQGQVLTDHSATNPFFKLDKYQIGGTVKDADGKPVKGAVVRIDRDRGEGFANSKPSDENGHYEMYYVPEDDEETYLYVFVGDNVKYTLPAGKVYFIPEETSVNIDITLPREGTEIEDKPPTLVSQTAPGALYTGMLVGLDVPDGVQYSVTLPDEDGNFTMTVPKEAWDKIPTFFETNMTKFMKEHLKPGDAIPSSFIEIAPGAARNIKA